MATFELIKTIEARKLNPRSKLPLQLPPVTIPYGAIVSEIVWERDRARFAYLGELYQCRDDLLKEALGGAVEPAEVEEAEAVGAAARAPEKVEITESKPSEEAGLRWEALSSDRFGVFRAKVPGGWLIAVEGRSGCALTFYPDPNHHWDGRSAT